MQKIQPLTIGIIGGGQLGKMMSHAAQSLGHKVVIFTDSADSPAANSTDSVIFAQYTDQDALQKFASMIDLATFEFENIDLEGVEFLNGMKPVFPKPDVLRITQNRLLEKSFLQENDIAVADFLHIKSLQDLQEGIAKFGKAILKTATMGYDGKGQFVLENQGLATKIWNDVFVSQEKIPHLILEKFCPFMGEISVMIARGTNGEIACYEPLSNIHKNGILDISSYPAKIAEAAKKQAQEIAIKIAQKLDLQGIMAVEFFVMENEKLLVNELAPRPHNSGHFSMNACMTSQFEQVIRAVTGLPLGSTAFHSTGFMKNLIGDDVNNIAEFLSNKNAKIHLYGKQEIKAGRKMGHVNVFNNYDNDAY